MERSSRRLAAALGILVLVPALGACGSTDSDHSGHLSGTVATEGGGSHTTVRRAEAEVTASPTSEDTSEAYTTQTRGDGSFTLDLPPGTYEVTGTLTGRNDGGHLSTQKVTVDGGKTTKVKLFAYFP